MPYILQERREVVSVEACSVPAAETAGELNYQITELINMYMADKVKNYACFNAIVGALESCKLEFYRRVVAPYENTKCEDNGDVW